MIRICFLAAIAILAVSVAAVPSSAGPFDLKVGQSIEVGPDGLTVGFDRVAGDSRCPIGVLCIWEGDAAVAMWAQSDSHERMDFELHTHAFFDQHSVDFHGYVITLLLVEPYPVYEHPIPPESYSVKFIVSSDLAPVEETTWGRIKSLYTDR
jgi:hypothetical protein